MKNCIRLLFVAMLMTVFVTVTAFSQVAINIKTGMESWSIQDEKELYGESRHPGQFFGFDVFVEKERKLFVPGFHYHRFSVHNEEERFSYAFGEKHHLHYFTIPLAFGYRAVDRSGFDLSLLAGPEVQFFYNLDDNGVGLDDDMLHGVSTAITGIVHMSFFSFLTAEVKYHYAFQPIIKTREESKLRGWTIALGVRL